MTPCPKTCPAFCPWKTLNGWCRKTDRDRLAEVRHMPRHRLNAALEFPTLQKPVRAEVEKELRKRGDTRCPVCFGWMEWQDGAGYRTNRRWALACENNFDCGLSLVGEDKTEMVKRLFGILNNEALARAKGETE